MLRRRSVIAQRGPKVERGRLTSRRDEATRYLRRVSREFKWRFGGCLAKYSAAGEPSP